MGKITGFIEFHRAKQPYRPVAERVRDWKQVMAPFPEDELKKQGARCMDCGIPFCHQGCPLGNLIPDWNDLVYRGQWQEAIERLHATNNFPEFTGTLCPAPCEGACVLGINDDPVTIKAIELAIIDRAFQEGWIKPEPPKVLTGKKVAVVGSGPAGLAGAQQLRRAGHEVTVFERDDRIGGLLRYGIPEFKMEKKVLDRRLEQMKAEGVVFKANAHIGVNVPVEELRKNFDAILLAGGACAPRDLPVPGRELKGVHFAMEYLTQSEPPLRGRQDCRGRRRSSAKGKHVVIIGGGDTGADCLGTANRQGAKSVHQLEIMPRPPEHARPGQSLAGVSAISIAWPRRTKKAWSGCIRSRPSVLSATSRAVSRRSNWSRSSWSAKAVASASRKSRAASSPCPASWRCWPWVSPVPRNRACWRVSA